MTPQEIFDRVAIHLIEQGRAATLNDGRCCYRTEDGAKCAFGCLIPDELYGPQMEDQLATDIIYTWHLHTKLGLSGSAINLIADLQHAHDNAFKEDGLEAWKARMRSIASNYALSPESLNHRAQSTE